jgi:hypothetical protein
MPVFSFYIPLYSFWRFDDFSWGKTHLVLGGGIDEESPIDGVIVINFREKLKL